MRLMCLGMQWRRMGSDMKPTGMYFDEHGKPYLVANPLKKKCKKVLKKLLKAAAKPPKGGFLIGIHHATSHIP